jgi:ADP-ribose pyrophosphatase
MGEKPSARSLGWRLRGVAYPFANQFLRVRQDQLVWPDGQEHPYTYVELKPVVLIVPVTTDKHVVLIRQFRYTIDDWVWEVPAGGSHDFDFDAPAAAQSDQATHSDVGLGLTQLAAKELFEEIGGRAGSIEHIGHFYPAVGKLDAVFHIYLATDVELMPASPEPGEMIELHPVSIESALQMARDGTLTSGASALAIIRCESRLRSLARRG